MALARQTAEQGIGDNDLKRLQRQFDSNKATFVNIDQKQRFMEGMIVVMCLLVTQVPCFCTCSSCTLQTVDAASCLYPVQDCGTWSLTLTT
jgi:hypothetical protein